MLQPVRVRSRRHATHAIFLPALVGLEQLFEQRYPDVLCGWLAPEPSDCGAVSIGHNRAVGLKPARTSARAEARGSGGRAVSEVLLASTWYLCYDEKQARIGRPYPPLGTLQAAAVVRRLGYSVRVFDSMLATGVEQFGSALAESKAKVIVLYDDNFNWLSKMCLTRMREAAMEMIRIAQGRGRIVLCSGSDMSDHRGRYLTAGADAILLGEGEGTLAELIPKVARGTDSSIDSVAGLALPNGANGYHLTAERDKLVDLDALPLPAWDLVDLDRYRAYWRKRHGYFSLNLVTTRGCPYRCNWCAKPIYGRGYSSRSPENVVEEMRWLNRLARPDHYWMADDVFGLKPGWVERFGVLVEAEGVGVPFTVQCRPDLMSASFVDGLRRAGCTKVWLGAESGSQKILDAMDKGTTLKQIRRARWLLGDAGVECAFFLQFGYPGETMREIEMTLDMLRELMPDDIGISVSYPLPGTPFFERVKAELGDKQNWLDSGDIDMLFAGEYAPEFYHVLHPRVHAEFVTRKAIRKLKGAWTRPWRLRPGHGRCLARALKHGWAWRRLQRRLERLSRHRNTLKTSKRQNVETPVTLTF